MNTKWLVLCREDFGRNLSLSWATDVVDSFAEADAEATEAVRLGSPECYVFRLDKVYMPQGNQRIVEEVYIGPA